MQQFTQKYTIICLFEDIEEGYEFSSNSWPLHSTLVDTFAIDWDKLTLVSKLQEIASTLKSLSSKAIKDEYFGPDKNVHVVLIEKTADLVALHYAIVSALKTGGLKFNDPQYNEEGFLPHATVQKHMSVKPGDLIRYANLALIDMFPDKDPYQRKILKIIRLP